MSAEFDHSGLIIPGADTRNTTQPATRAAIETFLDGLDVEGIERVLYEVLMRQETKGYYLTMANEVSNVVLNPLVASLLPTDVDPYTLMKELLRINHNDVWFNLLHQGVQKSPDLRNDLIAANPLSEPNSLLTQTSDHIAYANMGLYGGTLLFYSIAALYGNAYPAVIAEERKSFESDKTTPNPRYLAGLEASKRFGTTARDADEVIARLQTLFPANAQKPSSIPAITFAQNTHSFVGIHSGSETPVVICPARDTTHLFFSAYGNILAKPEYQARLKTAISKK